MWYQSLNESKTTIPPNVLKNLKVYDILEPQKISATITTNSDGQHVDKLIDIDDCSRDSGFQDSNLNASFLDKNRDYDLIDLYQNIFVTPQHIKKKDIASNDVVTNVACSNVFDADFNIFFDKLESGEKIDWIKNEHFKEEANTEPKPRVLVPNILTDPDSDPEDLIDEVLSQKNMEKQLLQNVNHSPKVNIDDTKNIINTEITLDVSPLNLNNSLTVNSQFENEKNVNSSDVKPVPVKSQISNSLTNFTVQAMQKDEKVYKKKRIVKPEHQTAKFTKGPDFYEKSVILPQIMSRMNARQLYLNERASQKKRLILDAGAKTVVNTESSNSNRTKQFDTKIKGSSSFETNSLKLDRIPNVKEPKLCINRTTESIAVHTTAKTCIHCNSSVHKKANGIVCGGATSSQVDKSFGKLSPIVLMEDCNRERIKALKQSQMFKNFVLKGTFEP